MVKRFISVLIAVICCFSFAACGGEEQITPNTIVLWAVGGSEEIAFLSKIKTAFNAEYEDVKMVFRMKKGYDAIVEEYSYETQIPDVTYVDDEFFKRLAIGGNDKTGYLEPLDAMVEASTLDVEDMFAPAVERYRYNPQNNTSGGDNPLYCVPKSVSPTVLFYNEAYLKQAGVICISVDEADLAEFNAGTKADLNGKKKSEYGKILEKATIPAKGYWNPQYNYKKGDIWKKPDTSIYPLVFNNRIPMSWDEIEDLSMLTTKSYNASSPSSYGFFTEWWFNYGWSVGGDCVGDTDGNGSFVFTLGDETPNYKVMADVTIDGTSYKASNGDDMVFLSYKDRQYLKTNASTASTLISENKLQEFPSTYEAFERFCALSRDKSSTDPVGLEIVKKPKSVATVTAAQGEFNLNGALSMFVGYSFMANSLSGSMDWNVAPLPVYKTYKADNITVDKIGKKAGHSKSVGLAISKASTKKEKAMKFIEFLAGEKGQKLMAADHYDVPNNYTVAMSDYVEASDKNLSQAVIEAQFQQSGDWWYMPDREWIANWSQPLNQNATSVRNSTLSLSDYFSQVTDKTNAALALWR